MYHTGSKSDFNVCTCSIYIMYKIINIYNNIDIDMKEYCWLFSITVQYIISWDNLRTDSEAQRRNVSFSVTIVNNDGSCWGLWSIVRTHAFRRQQALSVNHYSAKYLLDSSMCWGEKSLFVCFVFLLKLVLKIHLRASYKFRLSVFLHQPFLCCVSSANILAFTHTTIKSLLIDRFCILLQHTP